MRERFRKTEQPLIDRRARSSESRPMLVGALAALVGLALAVSGALKPHRLGGEGQAAISEPKLIDAARRGRLEGETPREPSATSRPGDEAPSKPKEQKKPPPDFCHT